MASAHLSEAKSAVARMVEVLTCILAEAKKLADSPERVQHSTASCRFTAKRRILERRHHALNLLERAVQASERHNEPARIGL